jgi:nucleotide-binding universal stress UspA family protein
MGDTVLVATDGSQHADRAVERAIDHAADEDATLHVLAVVDSAVNPEPALSAGELATIRTEDRYSDCLADVAQRADSADVEVTCRVCHGDPDRAVLSYAEEIDADAIFVGVHGDPRGHLGGVGRRIREGTDRDVRVVNGSLVA